MDDRPVQPEVRELTARAALAFEALGVSVEEAMPAIESGQAMDAWATMFLTDYAVSLGPVIAAGYGNVLPPTFLKWVKDALEWPATRYVGALREREWHRRRFAELFETYDLLLLPTMATTAFPIERNPHTIDGRGVDPLIGYTPFCFHANLSGLPAASVPCGITSDGLPVGLQIVGPWSEDELVLQASAAFETAMPWPTDPPRGFA
jgi:aspartyl-tRNA(Asn)/glutamyl-tRNA(Gln) amidotransferase subunit A